MAALTKKVKSKDEYLLNKTDIVVSRVRGIDGEKNDKSMNLHSGHHHHYYHHEGPSGGSGGSGNGGVPFFIK